MTTDVQDLMNLMALEPVNTGGGTTCLQRTWYIGDVPHLLSIGSAEDAGIDDWELPDGLAISLYADDSYDNEIEGGFIYADNIDDYRLQVIKLIVGE